MQLVPVCSQEDFAFGVPGKILSFSLKVETLFFDVCFVLLNLIWVYYFLTLLCLFWLHLLFFTLIWWILLISMRVGFSLFISLLDFHVGSWEHLYSLINQLHTVKEVQVWTILALFLHSWVGWTPLSSGWLKVNSRSTFIPYLFRMIFWKFSRFQLNFDCSSD